MEQRERRLLVDLTTGNHHQRPTDPHEADEFLVADRFVGLVVGRRTFGSASVTRGRVAASVVVATLEIGSQIAVVRAAGSLCNSRR